MTVEEKIQDFKNFWKNHLVDPEQFPVIFAYQLKLWKYYRGQHINPQKM